jgi:hypothetical protein
MGTKGVPDTKKNWPTDRRSQNQPQPVRLRFVSLPGHELLSYESCEQCEVREKLAIATEDAAFSRAFPTFVSRRSDLHNNTQIDYIWNGLPGTEGPGSTNEVTPYTVIQNWALNTALKSI